MSPKRGDRVAPPPGPGEWDVIFGTSEAAQGWEELCRQAATNARLAWQAMRLDPAPDAETPRHHRMRRELATRVFQGEELPQWQIEVTSGGRIWYVVDERQRRVVVTYASTRHPKVTDKRGH